MISFFFLGGCLSDNIQLDGISIGKIFCWEAWWRFKGLTVGRNISLQPYEVLYMLLIVMKEFALILYHLIAD